MASAKFLEEALSTDVDESAVNAIVGSLENQLVTATPVPASTQSTTSAAPALQQPQPLNQNHVNSAIPNGGTTVPVATQKLGAIANGDAISAITGQVSAGSLHNTQTVQNYTNLSNSEGIKQNDVNIVYTQSANNNNNNTNSTNNNQAMTSAGTIITNRVTFPTQNVPNGISQATVLQTTGANIQAKQPTLVIKTTTSGAPGLVTMPMNVTASVPQVNNVVNVRPGLTAQPQKGQPARVVLSAPQLVGARPGTPQLTLQSLQGLQPGQQGHLLLKTENGQYQLLRVGPAPAGGAITGATAGGQPVTFRMATVPAQSVATTSNSTSVVSQQVTAPAPPTVVTTTPNQRPANDNTKEKCRKFLANLLELSSREPKSVERNVRTLIQDLIDARVEPEDFCDKLERLLNASPQPCLIGFLKKSLPLLRHSLATKELTIDGIRPPPANVVFSIASGTPTVQAQIRPGIATTQVRLVTQGTTTTVVRPALQPRLGTPVRAALQQPQRMVTAIRQPAAATQPVIVSSSQPPALHPVFPANQVRPGMNIVRQPMQLRPGTPGQIRQPLTIRTAAPPTAKNTVTNVRIQGAKPAVPSAATKVAAAKEKEKKTFTGGAYTGDDDINDVAAMGGVNLAEETQRILGSTEFVGTQIRSCKEEFFLNMNALQHRMRTAMAKHGLDDPPNEVSAVVSHAVQERLKNLVEKVAIITEHRLEMVKSDSRYVVTTDIKGQLKFLEELDRAERKRHEEHEREMLMRAAKSRSKTEDPEQAKLKAKAKEMQRVEMEELRQREANATALQAIGPRKKPRLDGDAATGTIQSNTGLNSGTRGQLPLKQRMKKVTLRDLQFLFDSEKDLCKSTLLYKSYLK